MNVRPLPPQGSALPSEPHPEMCYWRGKLTRRWRRLPENLIYYITAFGKSQEVFRKFSFVLKFVFILCGKIKPWVRFCLGFCFRIFGFYLRFLWLNCLICACGFVDLVVCSAAKKPSSSKSTVSSRQCRKTR